MSLAPPLPGLLENLSRALVFGPEMLLFHAVFIAWIVIFTIHLRRPHGRATTGVLLYSLAILCGMLAPLHGFLRDWNLARVIGFSGALGPMEWSEFESSKSLGSLIIATTSVLLLTLSTWAWLMPRPERRDGGKEPSAYLPEPPSARGRPRPTQSGGKPPHSIKIGRSPRSGRP